MKKYSQNDEDEIIVNFFGDYLGRFLDIGAHNGKDLSNTKRLADMGWSGVLVEPSSKPFEDLMNLYQRNTSISLVKNAIDSTPGKKIFYDSNGDLVSSLVKGNVEKYGLDPSMTEVDCITPEQLFMIYGYDFDFISLDVEQTNFEIFKLLPFAKLTKLRCICVEHDLHQKEMTDIIKPFGFKEIARNPENIIFVR